MKQKWSPLVCLLWWGMISAPSWAQSATPAAMTLTLSQAVDLAVKSGDDLVLQKATLEAAAAANAVAQGKNGFTITTALGYGASESVNSPGNTSSKSFTNPYASVGATGIASTPPPAGSTTADGILLQSPAASVTLGTPMTILTGGWSSGLQTWPDGSSRWGGTASAKVTQTLWNGYWGGPTQAAADKAYLAYQVAQLTAQASRNKTLLAVKQAFFTMLSAQENLTLLKTTLESRKTTLTFTQAKYGLQQATDIDLLTAQVNEQSAELDLTDGQNALVTARQRLANLAGMETDAVFTAAGEPDPSAPAATLDEAVSLGLKNRTELQIADLNGRSSQVDLGLALGSATPSLALSASVADTVDLTGSRGVVVGQLGVTLGAPLWDAGQSGSAMAQAEKVRQGFVTQVHQLTRSVPVDIAEGWNAWQQAIKRYELAKVNVKNLELQLRVTKAQLEAGSKTLSDEFTAEINASTAEFGLLKAKITAQLAALQLQSLLGL